MNPSKTTRNKSFQRNKKQETRNKKQETILHAYAIVI